MLYHLFTYLDNVWHLPGAGLFQFLTFRAVLSVFVSLLIMIIYGRRFINFLRIKQVGESIRNLGLEGQLEKTGTPTMGGILIIAATIIPTLLFSKLNNIYIWLLLLVATFLGTIGFIDDYIKIFKKNKEGLKGKYKIFGQVSVGILVAMVMYFHPDIKVRNLDRIYVYKVQEKGRVDFYHPEQVIIANTKLPSKGVIKDGYLYSHDTKELLTNLPFLKNNNFNYDKLFSRLHIPSKLYFIPFGIILIFIITAVSNGANITDGIDGLCAGSSALMGISVGILTYVTGNSIFSDYLSVLYLPNIGELVIFVSAFIAACVGFLWWNAYPAQIFMGDTGSLALGGIIATICIIIRKELMIPIICFIFLIENLSVILQVSYFKYTKKKFGEGKRLLLMSPLHHHYQKKGIPEPKIVTRFWIVGIMFALASIAFLKIR